MKKSKLTAIILSVAAAVSAASLAGCSSSSDAKDTGAFEFTEYSVSSGVSVKIEGGSAEYKLIGALPEGISVSKDGTFTVSDGAANGAQVVLAAVKDGKIISTAICTISAPTVKPTVQFTGLSEYVLHGGKVKAIANPEYGVVYSLKTSVDGISVDPVSGRVTYTSIVEDSQEFTVVATANGTAEEKTFKAAVGDLIVAENSEQIVERGVGGDAQYVINFGDGTGSSALFEELGVIGVAAGGRNLTADDYSYDRATHTVTLNKAFTATLGGGNNEITVYTAKNVVTVNVRACDYIRTAEELAAIRGDKDALSGNYAMVNDIDLSDYLKGSDGGWLPIGEYRDVTDGTALAMAFRGTFDGLGHKVTGLWIDWIAGRDAGIDMANYFNAGLFGYVTADGVIKNLEVVSEIDESSYMCSYSGGLVGVNCGLVENCIAKVKVVTENDHRVAGGFVGRNEGAVRNCISTGWINAGSSYGAFCGVNQGVIENCYAIDDPEITAVIRESEKDLDEEKKSVKSDRPQTLPFCGTGSGKNCGVFESEAALITSADFTGWNGWLIEVGSLPTLIITEVR